MDAIELLTRQHRAIEGLLGDALDAPDARRCPRDMRALPTSSPRTEDWRMQAMQGNRHHRGAPREAIAEQTDAAAPLKDP